MPPDQLESCRQWESAIRSNRLDEVDRLIERGLDVNGGSCGIFESPLDLAIFEGNGAIVQRVIGCGAILNPNAEGRARVSHSTPLHLAASLGREDLVQLLLHAGALLDAEDSDGDTPLWKAVRMDHRTTAIRLVLAGADVEVPGMNGEALSDVAPWLPLGTHGRSSNILRGPP